MNLTSGDTLSPVSQDTMSDLAYSALRTALLRRQFGAEQQLDLNDISARLAISQTPIKSALRRLHDEGLVEIRPRQGTYVTAVTVERLESSTEARKLVEKWAVGRFTELANPVEWAKIEQLLVESELLFGREIADVIDLEDRFAKLDHDFHFALVSRPGNATISRFYESLNTHLLLARAWCLEEKSALEGRVRTGISEHRGIVRAMQAGNVDLATELLCQHIDESLAGACAVVAANGGRI